MAEYIELPLVTDSDALVEVGVDYLETTIPGFVARAGNVETVLVEAFSQIAAEVIEQAAQVDPVIFAYYGAALVGIPIQDATPSAGQATVTWAATTPATMLPAGSQLAVPHPSGESMLFETDTDVVSIDGGGTVLVRITAVEPGDDTNGCFGYAELVELVEGIQSVLVSTTGGGTDLEDEDAYLDRLADAFTILAPRPILPGDHATMARQVPGVGRAIAIDLLLPGTADAPGAIRDPHEPLPAPAASKTNEPRCTTVAVTNESGAAPSPTLMQTVWSTLDGAREVNFLNYVITPSYTTVAVQATVRAFPGFARGDVLAQALERVNEWLNPSLWGTSGSGADATEWQVQTAVRISEAVDYLNRAAGVSYAELSTVKLKAGAGAWQATDLVLAGLAPLPTPGVHELTVKLPGEA